MLLMEWWSGLLIVGGVIGAAFVFGSVGFIIAVMCEAFTTTPETPRERLRREYQKLYRRYEIVYDDYDCGRHLAEHINLELSTLGRRMREIEAEVVDDIREERARGNAVPFEL